MLGEVTIPTWVIIVIAIILLFHFSGGREFVQNMRGAGATNFETAMRSQMIAHA